MLVRAGHTEAAVDIARLAGLHPSGVICEIMNDDGTMARTPDLIRFAQFHGLKMATIADLIAYRLRHDRIVERILETELDSLYGGPFRMHVYANRIAYQEHVALVKGKSLRTGRCWCECTRSTSSTTFSATDTTARQANCIGRCE